MPSAAPAGPAPSRPTLVLLHGIPDTGRAWDGVRQALGPDYPCLAPDLPGFGTSAAVCRLVELADLRAAVEARVSGLDERFVLVVHDVGGLFGLAWAVTRSERLAAVVILNTSVFPDRRWHWGARLLRTPLVGELALRLTTLPAFRREVRRAAAGRLDDAAIARTFEAFGPRARATALRLYRLQTPALVTELPGRVRALTAAVPSLVVWGDRDPYLPPHFAERFGAGRIRHFDDLGHWPHLEAPDQVAAEIRSFLEAPDGAGLAPS